MFRQAALMFAMASVLVTTSGSALALGDQWYLGIGGGASQLQPNPTDTGIDLDEKIGSSGLIFLGLDIDNRSSGQLTLYSLGEATFDNGQSAQYFAGDASLIYRFFDSRDYSRRGKIFGASIYGRFGFGFIERDAELLLRNDTPVYFGAGGGVETYLTHNLGLRLEALFHETDTASATLSVVGRFGGRPLRRAQRPTSTTPIDLQPAPAAEPQNNPQPEVATAPVARDQATPIPPPGVLPEVYVAPTTRQSSGTFADANNKDGSTADSVTGSTIAPDTSATTQSLPAEPVSAPQPEEGQAIDLNRVLATTPQPSATDTPVTDTPSEAPAQFDVEIMADNTETLSAPDQTTRAADPLLALNEPTIEPRFADEDGDKIPDNRDNCPQSTRGYPVNDSGCPVFNGRWLDVVFVGQSAELMTSAYPSLNELARVMKQYPAMRLELAAHTDNSGTEQEQSNRTRQRLRTVGVYLVNQGISANRLVLRSYGGSRPVYDNNNALGRRENNRIEIFERP